MKKAENIIKDLLHDLGTPRSLHLQRAKDVWNQTISKKIREATTIRSFRNGILVIGVTSHPLLSTLKNFRKTELETSLSRNGLESLDEIKFEAV